MTEPFLIEPGAIYDDLALRKTLGMHPDQIARARRSGELRFCRRGGRNYYRGAWVARWLVGDVDQDAGAESNCQAVAR